MTFQMYHVGVINIVILIFMIVVYLPPDSSSGHWSGSPGGHGSTSPSQSQRWHSDTGNPQECVIQMISFFQLPSSFPSMS